MILENIDIDIDIDMVILENIDIDIDIDKAILQNIDIDKISNRFKFGISNRATWGGAAVLLVGAPGLGDVLSSELARPFVHSSGCILALAVRGIPCLRAANYF